MCRNRRLREGLGELSCLNNTKKQVYKSYGFEFCNTVLRSAQRWGVEGIVRMYMGKTGTIGQFFRALFPSTWSTLSPDMLCLPEIWDTRNTQNLPHFRAFPASIQEHSALKCLFFMASPKLPNRPGFALLYCKNVGSS